MSAGNTAEGRGSRFLERVDETLLIWLVSGPARASLDLLFVSREGLGGDVMLGDCLGHKDHQIIEFSILEEVTCE